MANKAGKCRSPKRLSPFRKRPTVQDKSGSSFESLGGVFLVGVGTDSDSSRSLKSSPEDLPNEWTSSGASNHHENSPLVMRQTLINSSMKGLLENDEMFDLLGEQEILGRVMLRSRQLPKENANQFANNHVMINNERTRKQVPPLKRVRDLDEIAREHAASMATKGELSHKNPSEIQERLEEGLTRRLGSNVVRGSNISGIHKNMMQSLSDKNNILDRRFTCVGLGTAKADDGTLYLCQIFRS